MVFQGVVSWVQHSVVLGVLCCQKLSNRIRTFSLKTNSSLKPTRISTRSFFAKIVNYFRKKALSYIFDKKASSQIFDCVLKTPLDDIRIFERITSKKDALPLRANINSLELWFKKWFLAFHHGMCFHLEKYHVLT